VAPTGISTPPAVLGQRRIVEVELVDVAVLEVVEEEVVVEDDDVVDEVDEVEEELEDDVAIVV
jgi:hypothetical protein